MAASVTAQNTPRQPANAMTALPASGARIGDTLNTSISSDISRAASVPVCRSRTTARGIAMPAAAPRPCTKRSAISLWISVASAQPTLASANSTQPEVHRRLAPHHVRDRPVEQLARAQRDEERRQAHLHRADVGIQALTDGRQGRQVHVDGEGADGREQAQQQGHLEERRRTH